MRRLFVGIISVFILLASHDGNAVTGPKNSPSALYKEQKKTVEKQRTTLHRKWKRAFARPRGKRLTKRDVVQETKTYLVRTFASSIAPAWHGTPWTMAVVEDGLDPDAQYAHQEGKGVSCSWFVVSSLANLGFRFKEKRKFAGGIAIEFQRALATRKKEIKRYWGIDARQLKKKLLQRGDGIYVLGLDYHIGLATVEGDTVLFHHSSFWSPSEVLSEPLEESLAIIYSEHAGFVVSPVLTHHNIMKWLSRRGLEYNPDKFSSSEG